VQITDEMTEAAAEAIYTCYVAQRTKDLMPMAYVRNWRELMEVDRQLWRKCARASLLAARACMPPTLEETQGGDESADNAGDD